MFFFSKFNQFSVINETLFGSLHDSQDKLPHIWPGKVALDSPDFRTIASHSITPYLGHIFMVCNELCEDVQCIPCYVQFIELTDLHTI